MDGEYKTLNDISLESNVLFFGKESCLPNYFLVVITSDKTMSFTTSLKEKELSPQLTIQQFNCKPAMFLSFLKEFLVFTKPTAKSLGHISGSVCPA